ncbi:MAG: C39 family peptidase [Deltaproteobacteria bacterium]|nr:C39 family peptidase [Deltaproteobacteria bacterium]
MRATLRLPWMMLCVVAQAGCSSSTPDTPPTTVEFKDAATDELASPDAQDTDGQIPEAEAGPVPEQHGPMFVARAASGEFASFALEDAIVAADGAIELPQGAGKQGTDPYGSKGWNGGNYYNGGAYRFGLARSVEWTSASAFDEVVPSFEATTPAGSWIEIDLAVRSGGAWSKDYVLGIWASSTDTVQRHSVDGQDDATAAVRTDTLALKSKGDALRLTVQLFAAEPNAVPRLRALTAMVTDKAAQQPADSHTPAARGKILDVPGRSQLAYPEGGVWCSPTSSTMLMLYWGAKLGNAALDVKVPDTAAGVYDWVYDGTGNWPFNTAHISSMGDGLLHGMISRVSSFDQIERLIAADIPVAISISFSGGALTGAPGASTDGHLIVVRGFTEQGDVVCNDPWFSTDGTVQVTYKRAELESAWSHSRRTTYVAWPVGSALPNDPLGALR